jgi:hypothetical protein
MWNMLAIVIERAKEDSQVAELLPHLVVLLMVECASYNMQIILKEYDLKKAVNIILLYSKTFPVLRVIFTTARLFSSIKQRRR